MATKLVKKNVPKTKVEKSTSSSDSEEEAPRVITPKVIKGKTKVEPTSPKVIKGKQEGKTKVEPTSPKVVKTPKTEVTTPPPKPPVAKVPVKSIEKEVNPAAFEEDKKNYAAIEENVFSVAAFRPYTPTDAEMATIGQDKSPAGPAAARGMVTTTLANITPIYPVLEIGLIKETKALGNTSVSMGMAIIQKKISEGNKKGLKPPYEIKLINYGGGGPKLQPYLVDKNGVISVGKEGKGEAKLSIHKKKDNTYDDQEAVRAELLELIQKEGWDLANDIILVFVTGGSRATFFDTKTSLVDKTTLTERADFIFQDMRRWWEFQGTDGNSQEAKTFSKDGYFLPQSVEGTLEYLGTLTMYMQIRDKLNQNYPLPLATFGIGNSSTQFTVATKDMSNFASKDFSLKQWWLSAQVLEYNVAMGKPLELLKLSEQLTSDLKEPDGILQTAYTIAIENGVVPMVALKSGAVMSRKPMIEDIKLVLAAAKVIKPVAQEEEEVKTTKVVKSPKVVKPVAQEEEVKSPKVVKPVAQEEEEVKTTKVVKTPKVVKPIAKPPVEEEEEEEAETTKVVKPKKAAKPVEEEVKTTKVVKPVEEKKTTPKKPNIKPVKNISSSSEEEEEAAMPRKITHPLPTVKGQKLKVSEAVTPPKKSNLKKTVPQPEEEEEEEPPKVIPKPTSRISKIPSTEGAKKVAKPVREPTPEREVVSSPAKATPAVAGTIGPTLEQVTALMTSLSKTKTSGSLEELQRLLPLDWSSVPLPPAKLKEMYPSGSTWNVTGINILLNKETKLEIPQAIRQSVTTVNVTSARQSGHVLIDDINVLAKCPNLQYLNLAHANNLVDLSPLSGLANLEKVNLSGCSKIQSLAFSDGKNAVYAFAAAEDLVHLDLSGCTNLMTLMGLEQSSRLMWLSLANCINLEDYGSLGQSFHLENLDVSRCAKMTDIRWILNLSLLNTFKMHGAGFEKTHAVYLRYILSVTLGFWNILAQGLEGDAFMVKGGTSQVVPWALRGPRVLDVLTEMMKECGIVVTVENDVFFYYLKELRKRFKIEEKDIRGAYCLKADFDDSKNVPGSVHSRNIRARTLLKAFYDEGEASATDTPFDMTELMKKKPKDLANDYDAIYAEVNALNKRTHKYPTFTELLGDEYGPTYAELCGHKSDDIYISGDGVGFYYDARRFNLLPSDKQVRPVHEMVSDVPMWHNKKGWLALNFQMAGENGPEIRVTGAHITSGETVENERERVQDDLSQIIPAATSAPFSFIVMDSNSGYNYENAYPKGTVTVSQTFAKSRFRDAVPLRGYEYYKMLGAATGQASKACKLTFDTVDKALYTVDTVRPIPREASLDDFGFVRSNPANYDLLHELRTVESKRKQLEKECGELKSDDISSLITDERPLDEAYPGVNAPSDHPPIVQRFELLSESRVINWKEKEQEDLQRNPYYTV